MWDKKLFALLLTNAIGDRKINEFGHLVDISGSYLSRLSRKLVAKPPSPEIIRKIADKAQNDVTYEHMMIAAGYINDEASQIIREDLLRRNMQNPDDLTPPQIAAAIEKLNSDLSSFIAKHHVSYSELEKLLIVIRALHEYDQK